jgi:hypothetical protein
MGKMRPALRWDLWVTLEYVAELSHYDEVKKSQNI